ncbi:MAG: T9SS type A sorting domain-containing protein [Calditrichaeota bacterium]|nr:T9SS type A sorting domain-containing protein [Calditrichota bacterium]
MRKFFTYLLPVLGFIMLVFFINNQIENSQLDLAQLDKSIMKESASKGMPQVQMSERKRKVKGLIKQDSPNKYREWQHGIRTRDGEDHPGYEFNYRIKELMKSRNVRNIKDLSKNRNDNKADGDSFIEVGPGNVSGRTRALVVDPDDNSFNTWYSGSVGGGVWKTVDAGQNWTQLTPNIGNLATSAIVQSPSNPDVLYVGTGEGFGNVDQIDGNGIWKTTDRGASWQQLASTANYDFQNIMRMIIDPDNEDIVLVATASGFQHNSGTNPATAIRRTTDGGLTWTQVFQGSSRIEDLAADPTNFQFQYATDNGRSVVKSNNGGLTWTSSTTGISGVGRMEIAVAPSDPTRIYISAVGGTFGSVLYISRDSGGTWVAATESGADGVNWLGGQGWYDNTIEVNPYNEDEVYVGGINIWRIDVADNNKITTTNITDGYGQFGGSSKGVHVDQHNIVMVKTDTTSSAFRMINCNDGGVSYSDNKGTSYSHTENGYNTSQFYGVDKKNGSNEYVGGMQDNNSYVSPVNPNSSSVWTVRWGGDGFDAAWNYGDGNKVLVSSQYNNIGRSTNGGVSFGSGTNGMNDVGSASAPFFTKIAKSKQDVDLVFAIGASGVWRSADFGANWSLTEMPSGFNGTSYFSQIKFSLINPQVIWTAQNVSSNSAPFVSIDGGFEFEQTKPLPFSMGRISGLATHPTQRNTAYILFSYAQAPKIVRTSDLGQTWEDITGFLGSDSSTNGFPDVAVYSLVVMPFDTTIIWAGTGIGLFESTDNGETWHAANRGLPPVAVYDMVIVNDQVVAATHGRGIWVASMSGLAEYEPPVVPLAPVLNDVAFDGKTLFLDTELRSVYDSTQIRIDGVSIQTVLNETLVDSVLHISYESDSSKEIEVRLYSYLNGDFYVSQKMKLEVFSFQNPVLSYVTDFEDEPLENFAGIGFQITNYAGFLNNAIHSSHDYENETEYFFTLLKPIIVSASNPNMVYSDVAIVEPGEPGSKFGDSDFWDYVIIEGSKDGNTWKPLLDGYDARFDPSWEAAWTTTTAYRNLFVSHTIDISKTFNAGDTILIRFRLFTDELENGWGWVIDSLQIQDVLVSIDDLRFTANTFSLKQNYPNPFNPETTINFSLAKSGPVSLKIYDITGKLVKTVYNNHKLKAGVLHKAVWDGKNNFGNQVSSGTFYYRLKAGEKISVKKMVLLR